MGKGNYSPWWPLRGNLLLLLFAASSLGSLAVHFVAWEPFSIAVSKAQRLWQGRGCEIHRLVGGRWAAEQQAWVAAYTVSACLQAGSRVLAGCRCFSLLAGAVARAKSWSAGEPGTGGAPELLLWCMVILLSGAGWSCMVEYGAPWCWCWGPAPVTRTCSSRRPRPKQHQGSRKLETILRVRLFSKLPKTIFNGKTLRAPCVLPAPPWKQHRLVPIQKLVFKERWNKTPNDSNNGNMPKHISAAWTWNCLWTDLKSDEVLGACQPMAAPVVLESVLCSTLQWTNMLRSQLDDADTGTDWYSYSYRYWYWYCSNPQWVLVLVQVQQAN